MPIPTTPMIKYEVRDRVAWVTLNRPEAMNALGPELSQGIVDAVNHAGQDDEVLCLVLIGEGGRAFSAGMDLKAMTAADAGGPAITAGPGDVFQALSECPKVVIAAIDGYCLAGGLQTASRCDMRIATRNSRFGMPEARRALAAVMTEDTPELFVPAGEAAWILLTGGHMDRGTGLRRRPHPAAGRGSRRADHGRRSVDERSEAVRAARHSLPQAGDPRPAQHAHASRGREAAGPRETTHG